MNKYLKYLLKSFLILIIGWFLLILFITILSVSRIFTVCIPDICTKGLIENRLLEQLLGVLLFALSFLIAYKVVNRIKALK